jgi:hypothetical protein
MQVLGRMKYGTVRWNAEIDLEETKIKNAAVVNKGDDSHNRDYEHQRVESNKSIELSMKRRDEEADNRYIIHQ